MDGKYCEKDTSPLIHCSECDGNGKARNEYTCTKCKGTGYLCQAHGASWKK